MAKGILKALKSIYFRSIPKTIYFNFKYLPFKAAIKLPIHIYHKVEFKRIQGQVIINTDKLKFAMILIGFPHFAMTPLRTAGSVWDVDGKVVFNGNAYLGSGSTIMVKGEGELIFGDKIIVTGPTSFRCRKKIVFGKDCILSWENLFLDTDAHSIFDTNTNVKINPDKEIIIGDKVWIGCRCTFIKGAKIGNNCVVGANSLVNKEIPGDNQIIGGNPAKPLKQNISWELK